MPRKTPRDPDQARKLARYFRERYLSPEAMAFADREVQRLKEQAANQEPVRPFEGLLTLTGTEVPAPGADFSADERARARSVLDAIRAKYGGGGVVH